MVLPKREGPILYHGDFVIWFARTMHHSDFGRSVLGQTEQPRIRCSRGSYVIPRAAGDGPASTTKVEPGTSLVRWARRGNEGGGITVCPLAPEGVSTPQTHRSGIPGTLPSCPLVVMCLSEPRACYKSITPEYSMGKSDKVWRTFVVSIKRAAGLGVDGTLPKHGKGRALSTWRLLDASSQDMELSPPATTRTFTVQLLEAVPPSVTSVFCTWCF